MDTSQEYIEMCEKAEEIQDSWDSPSWGDFIAYDGLVHAVNSLIDIYRNKKNYIWLPRQDQLQDMMNPEHGSLLWKWGIAKSFNDRLNKEELNKTFFLGSDEQYWLFLVMKEKYSKTWNPETKEWELIK